MDALQNRTPALPVRRRLAPLVGIGAASSILTVAILMGSSAGIFVDPVSMLLVGGTTGALTCAIHGPVGLLAALRTVSGAATDEAGLAHATGVMMTIGGLAVSSGAVGSVLGFVQMLQAVDSPTVIGPAIAVSLLSTFYGILMAMGAFSAAIRVAARRPSVMEPTAGISGGLLALGSVVAAAPAFGSTNRDLATGGIVAP